jgi:hypothetical protein
VTQTFSEVSGVTTITTTQVMTGANEPSALTAQQALWLESLVRAHGLIAPLQVSATARTDGTLSQTIYETSGTVTLSLAA